MSQTVRNIRWQHLLLKFAPAIILLLTTAVYIKAAFYRLTDFDDDNFIVNNALVKNTTLAGIGKIFTKVKAGKYNPLTTLSFNLEYRLFGLNPIPYHLDNIILHLLSTLVVFKIAERLSASRVTAIVVSALFAIHPMHVEEVAWASERKDTLYVFFFLFSLLVYLHYISSGLKWKFYFASFFLFVASLLAKSEAMTLSVILIAIDLYTGRKFDRRAVLEKIPFFMCTVVIAVISFSAMGEEGGIGGAAQFPVESYGVINRIFLFTSVPAFYILKLVAPFHLSAMHYLPDMYHGSLLKLPVFFSHLVPGWLLWPYYASLPFLALIIFLLIKWPSCYTGADKAFMRKQVLFGAAFFVVTISIMPQLVAVGPALTPERYTYVPYIGLFYITAQWLSHIAIPRRKAASLAVSAVILAAFCIITWFRIDVWQNSETLLTDMIGKNADIEDISYLYWLRGNARYYDADSTTDDQNRAQLLTLAAQDYTDATRLHPGVFDVYANRGAAYFQLGKLDSAIRDFDSSIRYNPFNAAGYYNRGSARATAGDYSGALADYNQCLKLNASDAPAYLERGKVRLILKDTSGACSDWQTAAGFNNPMADTLLHYFCK